MSPTVEIAVPVFNEERALEGSVRRLQAFCSESLPWSFRIVIADNASEDATRAIGERLAAELDAVAYLRLSEKGRGRALRRVWSRSDADVLAYMDVDLSTGLEALLPLVAPLVSGHSDLAIGTRLARGSRVVRGPRRELISRTYNRLLHLTLRSRFSDAQCGFKAGRASTVKALLPRVEDQAWFFDTELLVLAERSGLRIHEVPVDWVDDPDSRVDIVGTAAEDLRGIARLGGALSRFALVGVASTLLYLALFVALGTTGLVRFGWGSSTAFDVILFSLLLVQGLVTGAWIWRARDGEGRRSRHALRGLGACPTPRPRPARPGRTANTSPTAPTRPT